MHTFAQPDRYSCGAACLVTARALADPTLVRTPEGFRAEVLAAHRHLTGPLDGRGVPQVPWPRRLGTPPWTLARALGRVGGDSVRHRIRVLRPDRDRVITLLSPATPRSPVAVYVGTRWLPRHVVLVLGADAEGTRVYDPASGAVEHVSWARWRSQPLRIAGWDVPWLALTPRSGPRTRA